MSYYNNNDNNNYNNESEERGLFDRFRNQNNDQQRPPPPPQYGSQSSGGPSASMYHQQQPQQQYQQQYQQQPQQQGGYNMVGGSSQYGGNMPGGDYTKEEIEKSERNEQYKDWGMKAGMAALGVAAVGAAAYGIHEYRENKEEEEREEEEKEKRRRQEEEEENRRRQEEENRRRQEQEQNQYQYQHQNQYQQQGGYSGGGSFQPPTPMGRPPYSYDQNDVRNPDPARNSENSPTPHEYPEIRKVGGDSMIKVGSLIALKHNMTGRFLHSDREHSTRTGSNQQLVYGFHWDTDQNDWWQVLPANHDVLNPGALVSYGTQIRLRHVNTGHHLHSHYNFHDPATGQNEVTAFGDSGYSDENDHWVVEKWGEGAYGQNWNDQDVVVLRHFVSGMTLHSHDVMLEDDVQSVTCFGPGREENDKWRIHQQE